MSLFQYTSEGHIVEPWIDGGLPQKKHRKLNATGEDCYLINGKVVRDEDKIVAVQRMWKERVYMPGGLMYTRGLERWNSDKSQ